MNLTGRPDIVIPTYRPDTEKLSAMLDCLYRQTREPKAVIIVNTGREYWDAGLEEKYPALRVIQIGEDEFDHGGTRCQSHFFPLLYLLPYGAGKIYGSKICSCRAVFSKML